MRGKSSKNVSHTGVDIFWSLLWVSKTKIFLNKQVIGMAVTCCRMAYEQQI
jgi:hypothetical protein